jgi:hypothetical protein
MKGPIPLLCLALLGVPVGALADEPLPGLWELTLETRVPAEPGFEAPPQTISQCLTEADARDPSKVLGPLASSGGSDCRYTQSGYQGNVFRFVLQCASPLPLKTTGNVSFSASSVQGTMETSSTVDGRSVEFASKLSGRRLGDC